MIAIESAYYVFFLYDLVSGRNVLKLLIVFFQCISPYLLIILLSYTTNVLSCKTFFSGALELRGVKYFINRPSVMTFPKCVLSLTQRRFKADKILPTLTFASLSSIWLTKSRNNTLEFGFKSGCYGISVKILIH